jgi:DNA-binding beta-propeller fold protein YncE
MEKIIKKLTEFSWLFGLILLGQGCADDFGEVIQTQNSVLPQKGIFILNEGNFTHASGSLSVYDVDSMAVYNNMFYQFNQRPLGDVPNFMEIRDTLAYIVINNSARIEVVSMNTLQSVATINGFRSPREILFTDDNKAYVSDLYSDSLALVNTEIFAITGYIDAGRTTENLLLSSGYVFANNWSDYAHPTVENNVVVVVDAKTDRIVKKIRVGKEPNSIVQTVSGIFVLCSGGFEGTIPASVWKIEAESLNGELVYTFPNVTGSPKNLIYDEINNQLFFINQDIYQVDLNQTVFKPEIFITANDRLFYALAIEDDLVCISDAIDYQQRGLVYFYSKQGILIDSIRTGINPGFFKRF